MYLTKEEMLKLRGDLSPYLVHLTRRVGIQSAKSNLKSILTQKRINESSSGLGYFKYWRREGSPIQDEWLRATCFTETPIEHLFLHIQNIEGSSQQYGPYGLAFLEKVAREKGTNPVMHFDSGNFILKNAVDAIVRANNIEKLIPLLPLFQSFGSGFGARDGEEIDFRWEREWRKQGNFEFTFDEVSFGICPKADQHELNALVKDAFPLIDPTENIELIKHKLKSARRLAQQIAG